MLETVAHGDAVSDPLYRLDTNISTRTGRPSMAGGGPLVERRRPCRRPGTWAGRPDGSRFTKADAQTVAQDGAPPRQLPLNGTWVVREI